MEETTTTSKNAWFQDAMKKGLVLGAIHIVAFLLLYVLFPNKLTGLSYLVGIMALNLTYGIVQGISWRRENGGYLEYGVAFKYAFILLVFNGLIYLVFSFIFLLVDPSFPQQMADSQLDTQVYWATKFGAPEEALDKMKDEFDEEEMIKRFSFSGLMLSFGFALIFYAIGAAIIALFVRKREPEVI
jgi:hypothetical protein